MTDRLWTARWARTRKLVLERDRYVCQLQFPGCTGKATHADHVIPRRFGGTDDPANLRASCATCNLRRGDGTRTPDAVVSAW
jgi:5-methylcytosine-specific restriction endonuclease McrA